MATAVEPSSQHAPSPPANLLTASLVGAVYVLAVVAVVLYAVPALWAQGITPHLGGNSLTDGVLRVCVQIAAAVGLILFGKALAGVNPPKGLRGGVFLVIVVAVVAFLLIDWIAVSTSGVPGQVLTAIVAAGLAFGVYKLFAGGRGERWMVALEEQGWFHAHGYKKALGIKVRRLTILGILLIGASGVYILSPAGQNLLPDNWTITLPFTHEDGTPVTFTLLPDAKYVVPVVLLALTLWVAYRAVNVPTFAEFLIATEAEMNKVSWTSRRRLTQDTIVVLVTTVLMALFLLVVDLFWGWLLSRETVGVLPPKSTVNQKGGQVQAAKW
jgi:preprotein translocase SecE subunit